MTNLRFRLERIFCGAKYTIGKLYINDKYLCDMLEDPVRDLNKNGKFDNGEKKIYGNTAIPYGIYDVVLSMSPKFKRILPLICGVNSFEGIRIHAGNSTKDTEGCLLPGLNKEKGKVLNSKFYEQEIINYMKNFKGRITLEIV